MHHQLKPPEAATLPRHLLEAHVVSLVRQCPSLRALRGAHARLLRLRLPRLTYAFALSKLLASCAASATTAAAASYARSLFDQIPEPTAFCYNSLIRALATPTNPAADAFLLYRRMLRAGSPPPNSFTLAFALKACTAVPALSGGRQLHSQAFRQGLEPSPYVQTGLLNLYARCEEVALARSLFDGMAEDRNLVAWSSMIGGYSRAGMVNEALDLFRDMQAAGVNPDEVTMVSVISACAKAGALDLGRWVHAFIDRKGITVDLELSTALIDMYAKCGLIERARLVFDEMVERDTKAWSAMIVGLAMHGLAEDALGLFSRMLQLKIRPNNVTFIGVLSACAHNGLVDDGRGYWSTMQEMGIKASMENYGCMVDLLCRSGLLDEAYSFVIGMPILPNSVIWRNLLVASKSSNRTDIVGLASKKLFELEPQNPENYVLLSNLYALNSQWDRVRYMRKKMKDNNVTVVAGCSSIEIDGYLHKFVVSDGSHPEIKEIRVVLREIADQALRFGHKPWTAAVLHDVAEEEKEIALCEHSERLAIAYGLLRTKAPHVIRVVKNLRFCPDCHEVTKIISKSYDREIIVRDRVRFHRFIGGSCSCKDFW
ncbi:pentatricopeptide repeat-containing protein At2g02980, chloroplastic-like [Hordeum vulgare subsp. vulgare]|uniref:DYW domain-containing protein n=1 Tax=Hordeum vulgare subsp. vulgare TaxID=112509 RepID=A0A8I6X1P7_HORVV|nr:pentatricopeptide repeat-containing protein At2g02980, chloroplastic-like [Hordeum vulgare subsp. vulgare]